MRETAEALRIAESSSDDFVLYMGRLSRGLVACVVAVAVSLGSLGSRPPDGFGVRATVWSTQTVTVSTPLLVPL